MIVVDRPGFAASEPEQCVGDIRLQARALAPLLDARPGQRVLLVGQSYGAAIATVMARARPGRVAGVVLLSSYLGEPGPTARWLIGLGSRFLGLIPRDLRNAVMEVAGAPAQMAHMRSALRGLRVPVHMVHGERDDFAPIAAARRLAGEARTRHPPRFDPVPGADHFLNDGPIEILLGRLEAWLPVARPPRTWPQWVKSGPLAGPGIGRVNLAAS